MRITNVHPVYLVLAAALIAFGRADALPKRYVVQKGDSQVAFSITKWLVFKEEGRFKEFSGSILYDPEHPAALSIELTVQTASVDSRIEQRDRALRSEDYFDVARYPAMTFRSASVTMTSADAFAVTGDLTIRDVTQRITVPVRLVGRNDIGGEMGELLAFETEFPLNRLDYHVGTPSTWLGNDVAVHLLLGANNNEKTASR